MSDNQSIPHSVFRANLLSLATSFAALGDGNSAAYLIEAARRLDEAEASLKAINERASPDPVRTADQAFEALAWCSAEARRALGLTGV
jgi:hypothetical protein